MRKFSGLLVVVCGFICGCPFLPNPEPAPESVLAGSWSVTPEGDTQGWAFEAEFDDDGDLVEFSGVRAEDGATASLAIGDAETSVDGTAVTITVPDLAGQKVFEGTLSADENTITGSVSDQIELGDLEAIIPGGDLTFERLAMNP